MEKVFILRLHASDKETEGVLIHIDENRSVLSLHSLELPYINNQEKISCIPKGKYDCIYSYSESLEKFTYEVLQVPKRKGIRIHAANYYTQLQGCIALGINISDINHDNEYDTLQSTNAITIFEDKLKQQPFELHIL